MCCMFQMASADTLTALIDFYNLKKEGKVALVNGQPCLTSNKTSIEGMFPILAHLHTKANILGQSPLEKALVRQWISFQVWTDNLNSLFSIASSLVVSTRMIRKKRTSN